MQKSIDLTPLLPNAGPTGGEGLACPAPTRSLTIWFFCGIARDMVVVFFFFFAFAIAVVLIVWWWGKEALVLGCNLHL